MALGVAFKQHRKGGKLVEKHYYNRWRIFTQYYMLAYTDLDACSI